MFHQVRMTTLPKHWDNLFHGLKFGEPREREFLVQCVNQELFQQIMAVETQSNSQRKATEQQDIPPNELNAMQYACGFVPFKLIRKYEKNTGKKVENFLECLRNMAVVSNDHDPDLLSYTRLWFETTNRGGLFPLNDETFSFFVEVEKIVRIIATSQTHGQIWQHKQCEGSN